MGHFILDREQIDKELACRLVGVDKYLFLLEYHAGVLFLGGVRRVQNGGVQLADGGVLWVVNNQRRVVALQFER